MKNHKYILFAAAALVLAATICGGKGNVKENEDKHEGLVIMCPDEPEITVKEPDTSVMSAGSLTEPALKADESVKDSGYDSIAELFKATDPEWNESETYTEAVAAYDALLPELLTKGDYLDVSRPHFIAAYIDKDDTPELLVSYGSFHPCGVCVYHFDPHEKEVCYLGEYGIYGQITYEHKAGHLDSSTGGKGFYTHFRTDIDGSNVTLGNVTISDGTGLRFDGFITYTDVPVPEGIDGSHESMDEYGTDWINAPDLQGEYRSIDDLLANMESGTEPEEDNTNIIEVVYETVFAIEASLP